MKSIRNIIFIFVDATEVLETTSEQERRFALAKPVPETRSFHWFVPVSKTDIPVGYI